MTTCGFPSTGSCSGDPGEISVLDAGFLLGDGVWEAFRLHDGVLVFLTTISIASGIRWVIALKIPLTRKELVARIEEVVKANDMHDEVHIRLIVTRGLKPTPYQAPWVISSPPGVIIPEFKRANPTRAIEGIHLVTVDVIRGPQNAQDPRINSLSKHNCIAGCIDAERKGGEEGLMLDPHGHVATCNSTHFFVVRAGEVWTSTGAYCLDGITRRKVLDVCREAGIVARELDFDLEHVRTANEAFVTGTFAGVTPVVSFDGVPMSGGRRLWSSASSSCTSTWSGGRRVADTSDMVRIAMWSGPRNLSTAMMYAFASRADTYASDEPFYAHYLATTGVRHPLASEVIAAGETDWQAVAHHLTGPVPSGRRVWYRSICVTTCSTTSTWIGRPR